MRRNSVPLLAAMILLGACTAAADAAPSEPRSANTVVVVGAPAEPDTGGREPAATSEAVPEGDDSATGVPANASYIARPLGATLDVFDLPSSPVALTTLDAHDERGVRTTLAITGHPDGDWVQLQLSQRPNFTTGWVRAADIEITWTTLRVVVDLDAPPLTLFDGDSVVTHGTVAIGTEATPTPRGRTYVVELLASVEPDAIYGPFALGLALFSDEVTEYAGGNGQIGIHGTNRPDLLGERASLGCVRVHDDLIRDLAGRVPLGTPVDIV